MQAIPHYESGLVLRALRLDDAEAVSHAAGDEEIRRWTNAPHPFTVDAARMFIAQTLQWWQDGTMYAYGMFDEATGELVGGGLGRPLDDRHESVDVGGWLSKAARAKGLSVKGYRAACRMAFQIFGFQRVVARIEIGNHASRAVVERLGFVIEGVDPNDFRGHGAWIASLLPEELLEDGAPETEAARRTRAFGTGSIRKRRVTLPGGERIMLRALAERDVPDLVAAYGDPDSRHLTGADEDYGTEQAEAFVNLYAPSRWERHEAAVYAIADADNRFAGAIEMVISPDPQVASISVMVAPWARGRGYASAALRDLACWGHSALGLARVEARADVANQAARRALEKAGFTVEGVVRAGWLLAGKRSDALLASLLPGE